MSYEEQIMFKDKYPSIFSPQMEAIVIIIQQIFYATRAVLKIGEYPQIFPSFIWGIFAHVTRFDQSRASENICWIIMTVISIICFLKANSILVLKLLVSEHFIGSLLVGSAKKWTITFLND